MDEYIEPKEAAKLMRMSLDEFLEAEEAAKLIRRSVHTLYNYKCQGKIRAYKPGGRLLLFRRSDLLRWIENGAVPANDEIAARAARA